MTTLPRLNATEVEEQIAVVQYCTARHIPVFHIPNGGSRYVREAARLKQQGVMPGVPDLMIPVPRNGYHGLFVEMKRKKGGRTTTEQYYWRDLLSEQGYKSLICYGADAAIEALDTYVKGG